MAQLKTSDLSFGQIVKNVVRSQLNRNVTLANLLEIRQGMDPAGPRFNVEGSGSTVATHSEGASYVAADQDEKVQATLGWGRYHGTIEISDEAIANGLRSGNPAAYDQLFLRELRGKVRKMAKELENDSFNGSGSNSLIGLESALDDSNTYANIDRSTKTYWQAHVDAPGSLRSLTKANVRNFLYNVADSGGEGMPTVALCAWNVFEKVVALYDSDVQINFPAGSASSANVGSTGITQARVEGTTFIPVANADGYNADNNGFIYALNTDFVYFETIPYDDSAPKVLPFGSLPLGMQIVRDPTGKHSESAVVRTRLQLVVEKPAACGIMKDIDIS